MAYEFDEYKGAVSTLCPGCGHDSISAAIAQACFENQVEPHKVVKISGIGCSSKTPTYFLGKSHGFNATHGRMPSIITGAALASKDLTYIGVSGDGDTASIGIGQFLHVMRLNLNMTYLVFNNGCYGLTKGQVSATADKASVGKREMTSDFAPMDLVELALISGAGFVARSVSNDKKNLVSLIKEALNYKGFAFIDIISPCVAFNNEEGSTKSYPYLKKHQMVAGNDAGDYNAAFMEIQKAKQAGLVLTGLVYKRAEEPTLDEILNISDTDLRDLTEAELCPMSDAIKAINKQNS